MDRSELPVDGAETTKEKAKRPGNLGSPKGDHGTERVCETCRKTFTHPFRRNCYDCVKSPRAGGRPKKQVFVDVGCAVCMKAFKKPQGRDRTSCYSCLPLTHLDAEISMITGKLFPIKRSVDCKRCRQLFNAFNVNRDNCYECEPLEKRGTANAPVKCQKCGGLFVLQHSVYNRVLCYACSPAREPIGADEFGPCPQVNMDTGKPCGEKMVVCGDRLKFCARHWSDYQVLEQKKAIHDNLLVDLDFDWKRPEDLLKFLAKCARLVSNGILKGPRARTLTGIARAAGEMMVTGGKVRMLEFMKDTQGVLLKDLPPSPADDLADLDLAKRHGLVGGNPKPEIIPGGAEPKPVEEQKPAEPPIAEAS